MYGAMYGALHPLNAAFIILFQIFFENYIQHDSIVWLECGLIYTTWSDKTSEWGNA